MNTNRQWLLAKRPHGEVGKENFEYAENPIPEPGDGEVLLRGRLVALRGNLRAGVLRGPRLDHFNNDEGRPDG